MEKRTIFALVGFVSISICAALVHYVSDLPTKKEQVPRPIPEIPTGQVVSLEVTQAGGKDKVLIEKTANAWQVISPFHKLAEQAYVEEALSSLEKIKFGEITSEKKEQYAELDVDNEKGIHVIAKDSTGKVLADLYIGKAIGLNTMVRVNGKDAVWKVTGLSRSSLRHEAKDWRNHAILKAKADDASEVTYEKMEKRVTVLRNPIDEKMPDPTAIHQARWSLGPQTLALPPKTILASRNNLDYRLINQSITTFSELRANDFDDEMGAEHAKAVGLYEKPMARVQVAFKNGDKKELWIGQAKDESYYVKTLGDEQIYLVSKTVLKEVLPAPIDVLDKTITDIPTEDISQLEVVQGNHTFLLQKTAQGFRSEQVDDIAEDKAKQFVSVFGKLSGENFVDEKEPFIESLKHPKAVITIKTKTESKSGSSDARPGMLVTIKVGEKKDTQVLMETESLPRPVWVSEGLVERLLSSPDTLKRNQPPAGAKMPARPMPSGG